jgi:hypothetical protein
VSTTQQHGVAMDGNRSPTWCLFGKEYPKSEITYFSQIIIVFIVIITSILNLSLTSTHQEIWLTLLSSSIGYVLPSPSMTQPKP